jgi:hypothetical protein
VCRLATLQDCQPAEVAAVQQFIKTLSKGQHNHSRVFGSRGREQGMEGVNFVLLSARKASGGAQGFHPANALPFLVSNEVW